MSGVHRSGTRFVLEREVASATGAYLVRIERPGLAPTLGRVDIPDDGGPIPAVAWQANPPSDEHVRFVAGIARAIQSGARRDEGWPRRVARWRGDADAGDVA